MPLDKSLLRLVDLKVRYFRAVHSLGELVGKAKKEKIKDDLEYIVRKTMKVRSTPYIQYYLQGISYSMG